MDHPIIRTRRVRQGAKSTARFALLAFTSAIALNSAGAAMAQDKMADAAGSDSANTASLEDIVVTAQRKAERLQEVPISISAVSADALAQRGVVDVVSLPSTVSGLNVSKLSSAPIFFIRGVGSVNSRNEASVATYVDGIYYAAPFGNLFSLTNIDRIEVLKGPQGTLFGRNATGGVIQIVTRRPSSDPKLEMSAGYANYDTYSASGYASTGIGENIAVDVAVQYRQQRDGWGRNIVLDIDQQKGKEFAIRSKVLFTPTDRTEITVSGDYYRSSDSHNNFIHPKGAPDLDGVVRNIGRYDSAGESPPILRVSSRGIALRLEHDLDFAKLVSLTSRRVSKNYTSFDYDTSPKSLISPVIYDIPFSTWTQELQLLSSAGSKIDWSLGGFFFDGRSGYTPNKQCGSLVTPNGCLKATNLQYVKSYSIYGQATYEILPRTKVTLGLRYTRERQHYTSQRQVVDLQGAPVTPLTVFPRTYQKFDKPTWRVAVDYKFSQDVHAYISYNRGIKSGGFDGQAVGSLGFKPELLDAFEIGLKSELLDRRVRFNASAFYYDYSDLQVSSTSGLAVITKNAAAATIKGMDAEINVAVTRGLTLNASGTYLHGRFDDYPNPPVFRGSLLNPPAPPIANAKGLPTIYTPEFTGNIGALYSFDTDIGSISASTNVAYNSGYSFEVANRFRQKSYTLLNATLSWTDTNERWSARLWANNITNEHYLVQGVTSSIGDLYVYAAPRTYGLTLTARY